MHFVLIIEALIVAIIVGTVREYWWMGIISFICMMIFVFAYPVLYSVGMGIVASLALWAFLDFSQTVSTFIFLAIAFATSLMLHLALIETVKEDLG